MSKQKPREIAARILQRRELGRSYVEDLLEQELERTALSPADRSLVQELAYGVVRWQRTLDWLIDRKASGRTQKQMLRLLLRLGLYQLFWLDRIPNHAAVHETVELAKQLGFGAQAGFVNALLRSCIRERAATDQQLQDLQTAQPALGYSHPDWLCARWEQRWGAPQLRELLAWNNTPAKIFARLNGLKTDISKLLDLWTGEGVRFAPFQAAWLEDAVMFQLDLAASLARLPSFQHGLFYVQDPSTLLAVQELNPQPGETVLDTCAAPGGKTAFIAQRMQNRGHLVAQDVSAERRQLLTENCARLGVTCLETARPSDVTVPELTRQFDRIVVDAPCSNTGVLRRRLDLRWRIRAEELSRLQKTQLELLDQAALQMKPGGTLVYSTCSLEPEENHAAVEQFLTLHPGFHLDRERELLPFADGVDGAYVARLTKAADL
ncbi:MAG: 16S rRNA (cytosine(967)-C(5))-methyltransferase RsmB [Chloroflexi bacterium]|nr:16S rRNA (cytosine(967)-C(5))-methyltransferase RsmB [Chloroflexota bacterium]